MEQFNQDNWNYVQYINKTDNGTKRVIISIGAISDAVSSHPQAPQILYFATLLDEQNNELFQEEFTSLALACDHVNNKFSHCWDFIDLSQPDDSDASGCSSCVAH